MRQLGRLVLGKAAPLLGRSSRPSRGIVPLQMASIPNQQWTQRRGRSAIPEASSSVVSDSLPPSSYKAGEHFYKGDTRPATNEDDYVCPFNPVGVQLLSGSLQRQIFPPTSKSIPVVEEDALSLSQHHLRVHGLEPEQASTMKPIAFDLPPLQGNNLDEHFWNIGRKATQPWLGMAQKFAQESVYEEDGQMVLPQGMTMEREFDTDKDGAAVDLAGTFPPQDWLDLDPSIRPECLLRTPKWLQVPGWVRYPVLRAEDGARALGAGVPVEYPLEEDGALVFDVETMVQGGDYAIMATAAGSNAWYTWISPWLLQRGERHTEKDHLIPFGPADGKGSTSARLLIGHHINFDRARIRDEYTLKRNNIRYLDTMSLHIATRGISSPQRPAWAQFQRPKKLIQELLKPDTDEEKKAIITALLEGEEIDEETLTEHDLDLIVSTIPSSSGTVPLEEADERQAATQSLWQAHTSRNSLADVAKLHCGLSVAKDPRNIFVEATDRSEILASLEKLLTYCATDVYVTHKVFSKVWPVFHENCPNPATMAGVLGLSSVFLPVDSEWTDFLARCNALYDQTRQEVYDNLVALAEHLRVTFTKGVTKAQAQTASDAKMVPLEGSPENLQRELERPKMPWEHDMWSSQLDWSPRKAKSDKSEGAREDQVPQWYRDMVLRPPKGLGATMALTPAILRLAVDDKPFVKSQTSSEKSKWKSTGSDPQSSLLTKTFLTSMEGKRVHSLLGPVGNRVLTAIREKHGIEVIRERLREAADALLKWATEYPEELAKDEQLRVLAWDPVDKPARKQTKGEEEADTNWWPKWYHELYKKGELDITVRSKATPLLLNLSWQKCPLHRSREHGWVFRYDPTGEVPLLTRQKELEFADPEDQMFRDDIALSIAKHLEKLPEAERANPVDSNKIAPKYYKVPHAAGPDNKVGTPFSKPFVPFFENGTLQSEHPEELSRIAAKNALNSSALCSYWISSRDRVGKQMVVWDGQGNTNMHIPSGTSGIRQGNEADKQRKKGLILPQIVPMGTVTRRAMEKTWLTASNAKKNRVGSELKSMIKAPPGYSIVGADVDSQELWICSVMGDAQFGFHGATAVGWMTLEGSKSMGTDLHSKTAKILGTSRNQAKVFNYSRIYGAGLRHSSQLLMQAWPDMKSDEAMRRAKALYESTKGSNTRSDKLFERPFWYGGTESFVFNKLEEIALRDRPMTPALDCGVTLALQRKYLSRTPEAAGGDYMPSRVNWVVQSSGVDYLHLLITSMEHLITTYNLEARFMISVHDEVRYLAKDKDVERVALALQIANLWTRAMFAHKLQMDTLPQGVGFFAQVDVDKVLRKETDDPCITPSQTEPLPFGRALDIYNTLDNTHGGSLFADGRPMHGPSAQEAVRLNEERNAASRSVPPGTEIDVTWPPYKYTPQEHRAMGERGLRFLQAQAARSFAEVSMLEERVARLEGRQRREQQQTKPRGSGHGNMVDRNVWDVIQENVSDSSGTQTRTMSTSARSIRGGSMDGTRAREHSMTKMGSRGMHTSALPSSIASLVKQFPPRPPKIHVMFFKTHVYRFTLKWKVYAALLRQCPKEHEAIRDEIRRLTRAHRHATTIGKTSDLRRKADEWLTLFEQARDGDAEAQETLRAMNSDFDRKHHLQHWQRQQRIFLAEREEEAKPVPRFSGALLPPSVFNPPMLRFKPRQPDHMTMKIVQRRRAREGRQERWVNMEEILRQVQAEYKAFERSGQPVPLGGEKKEWIAPIVEYEQQPMEETKRREEARAQMMFTTRQMRFAKHARRRRDRIHSVRRRKLAEQKEAEKASEENERAESSSSSSSSAL